MIKNLISKKVHKVTDKIIIGTSGIFADINHIIHRIFETLITNKESFDRFIYFDISTIIILIDILLYI